MTSLSKRRAKQPPRLPQAPPCTRATTPTPLIPPCFRDNLGPVQPAMWAGRGKAAGQGRAGQGRAVAAPVLIRYTLFLRLLARQDSSGVAARVPVFLLGGLQGHVFRRLVLGFLQQLLEESWC
jgi:hypothetical protein